MVCCKNSIICQIENGVFYVILESEEEEEERNIYFFDYKSNARVRGSLALHAFRHDCY